MDQFNSQTGAGAVGTGVAYLQSSSSFSFDGSYGFDFSDLTISNLVATLTSGIGQISVDAAAGSLTGTFSSGVGSQPVQGTFTASPTGRLPGTLAGPVGNTPPNPPVNVAYYLVDSTQGFVIYDDTTNPSRQVVFIGDFARRTPVCPTCNDLGPVHGGASARPIGRLSQKRRQQK